MEGILFNCSLLADLSNHLELHFTGGKVGYDPIHSYIKNSPAKLTPKQVVNSRIEIDNLFFNLEPSALGMPQKCNPRTTDALSLCTTTHYLDFFDTQTHSALQVIGQVNAIKLLFDRLVKKIIPIRVLDPIMTERKTGRGFSSHRYIGGIFTEPCLGGIDDLFEYALNIVHELGHQSLMRIQWYDKIFESDPLSPVYSVIRKIERPAILSLHALVANTFMLRFCKEFLKNNGNSTNSHEKYCNERLKSLLQDQISGAEQFSKYEFTPLGSKVFIDILSDLN